MNITIIDDEKILAQNISKKLEKQGFCVNVYYNCADFYNSYQESNDLYIVDIWLPDGSWFEIIKWLREVKQTSAYIIITSAFWDIEKKIYWLDSWADDYMTKPCNPEELIARIKANLRRDKTSLHEVNNIYKYKDIEYDLDKNVVRRNNQIIDITKKERLILRLLMSTPWKLIEKNMLISQVWNTSEELWVSDNTINVTLSKLRKKLWKDFRLKTKINEWYILEI